MLYLINAVLFTFVGGIWSTNGLLNVIIKTSFLLSAIANAIFGVLWVDTKYPWMRAYVGF